MTVDHAERDAQWAGWMRLALEGDARAYHAFLQAVTPHMRRLAHRCSSRYGGSTGDLEDVVQDILLTLHLKRGTWDPNRPIGPWLAAIARNKMIDSLRRRGRRIDIPIEDVMDGLAALMEDDPLDWKEAIDLVARLKDPQRDIVHSISIEGQSIRETASRLMMSEGAVRVALHRALKTLAALYKGRVL